jgi:hypothetical protein
MTAKESFHINGEDILNKIKELIAEGNVRRITITNKHGKELASFSLTVGVAGAILVPPLAVVAAVAAIVGECTITVEKQEDQQEEVK